MAEPKITLIGTPSSRAMRNIWMLTELKLPYESDPITTADPRLKQAPYTGWNPNGKIPTLLVDGFAVYESLAINFYLDLKFPSDISLRTAEEKALGMQWATWVLTEIEAHSFAWYLNTIGKPEAERDAAAAGQAWEKLQKPLAVLEQSLAARAWLLGERFTVADVNTASVMYRALWMPLEAFPRTQDWLHRCWAREGGLAARRARGEKV
jgi:glutathione S-transferase